MFKVGLLDLLGSVRCGWVGGFLKQNSGLTGLERKIQGAQDALWSSSFSKKSEHQGGEECWYRC